MIDVALHGTDNMRMTTKLIAEQALARGWRVWQYYAEGSQLRVVRRDGKVLELYSASPPTTTQVAGSRANDKYFTTMYLGDAGLPVPETYLHSAEDSTGTLHTVRRLFAAGKKCVVKPLDAGHGDGITVAVGTEEQARYALDKAKAFSSKIIVQEYFPEPVDLRITCIDYRFTAALVRIPARVQGDGKKTVASLIDSENQRSSRGKGYTSELNVIDKDEARRFLGDEIQHIPEQGEWVQVVGTANVGTGGETQDVTDAIPAWLRQLAEQTAQSMSLPVCGVDFLLSIVPTTASTKQQLSPVIIELNHCPSLFIHETPIHGTPQPVVSAFLDYLESL